MSADRRSLAAQLRKDVRGEVRFDAGTRALYSVDGANYRYIPIGVVVPRDADDVAATVAACRDHDAPVLPRGGGTSLAGQCCNVAVVVDCSKYMRKVIEVDAEAQRARVEPGVVLDDLQRAAAPHSLRFAPDPSTHAYCTLGGMLGNNSCGVHSVLAGKVVENTDELDVLTYRGERLRVTESGQFVPQEMGDRLVALRDRYADLVRRRYPKIPRRVSGYNLDHLLPENGFNVARALVGTEGTCAFVLEATVRLVPWPRARSLLVLAYPDVFAAAEAVPTVLEHEPMGLEGIDDVLVDHMKRKHLHPDELELLPDGGGWLLVEFGGESRQEADAKAQRLVDQLGSGPQSKLYDDARSEQKIWEVREAGLGATARVPGLPDTWEGWEDAAVPPDRLADYLRDFRRLLSDHGYTGALYGHFGDGCIHTRIDFDLRSAAGIRRYRSFIEDAADLVVSYGGSLSGEHGDGQSRAELLPRMFGDELVGAFREFKAIWDPDSKMNPGKVVDPYPIDANLRLGTAYNPPQPKTHFSYSGDDRGSFARAALRCVGVGKCRKTNGETMCPSYMVTLEEMHSTRGRARLLFELLQRDPLTGGWREDHVKEALDLCLACKACKHECPVNVDMATYKAEFLAHYYARRLRPPHAYAFGLIDVWARTAAVAPAFATRAANSRVAKRFLGVAPQRRLPAFAKESFRRSFRARDGGGRDRVLFWPDTFNNYFRPETAHAAVRALEDAGFAVQIPGSPLCCGRPLYDYGLLTRAKRALARVVAELRAEIRAGVPLVGIEPSCVAVFRDELTNLFPNDEDAKRLAAQTFLLSEFLERAEWEPPRLRAKALVHGHCHHKSVLGFAPEERMLERLGLDVEIVDSGCCGMAGAFGFEREKYDVSVACGERVLLPAVRDADEETMVVADGFSCREQIEQLTGRPTHHLADVIATAIGKEGTT